MNSATATHWQSSGPALRASPRLLAGCVLASVVVHAVLLLVLPGWWRPALPEAPAVIDVVLMPADLLAAPVAPPLQQRAPAAPQATNPAPHAPAVLTLAPEPARVAIAMPAASAEAALAAATESPRSTPGASSSAPPVAARAEPLTPPVFNAAYLRNPPPRYPPAARRSGDEGTVLLKVLVTSDGAAARVELDRSSGSVLLDGAALDAVRVWQFVPARRGAQNVEDWVRVPVVFRLES